VAEAERGKAKTKNVLQNVLYFLLFGRNVTREVSYRIGEKIWKLGRKTQVVERTKQAREKEKREAQTGKTVLSSTAKELGSACRFFGVPSSFIFPSSRPLAPKQTNVWSACSS